MFPCAYTAVTDRDNTVAVTNLDATNAYVLQLVPITVAQHWLESSLPRFLDIRYVSICHSWVPHVGLAFATGSRNVIALRVIPFVQFLHHNTLPEYLKKLFGGYG